VAFEVRDKPASLKADDWARVVAVFVLGKEWQFKDWPFKDHVDIFNKGEDFLLNFVVLHSLYICNLYKHLRASFYSRTIRIMTSMTEAFEVFCTEVHGIAELSINIAVLGSYTGVLYR
jgi:hypothetical protein